MNRGSSLLEQLCGLIERTYGFESGLDDLGRFVVGNAGYRRFYEGRGAVTRVDAGTAQARTLVRESPDTLRACIYYPDEMIDLLEREPPQRGLAEHNVDAFSILIEELDHLLLLVSRRRQERSVSLIELELQANVTKYLVLSFFLAAGRPVLRPFQRVWLRHHLFEKGRIVDDDPYVEERYRQAARGAVKFIDGLPGQPSKRLATLRRFHDAGMAGKQELIGV